MTRVSSSDSCYKLTLNHDGSAEMSDFFSRFTGTWQRSLDNPDEKVDLSFATSTLPAGSEGVLKDVNDNHYQTLFLNQSGKGSIIFIKNLSDIPERLRVLHVNCFYDNKHEKVLHSGSNGGGGGGGRGRESGIGNGGAASAVIHLDPLPAVPSLINPSEIVVNGFFIVIVLASFTVMTTMINRSYRRIAQGNNILEAPLIHV
jgi:hypothetical protein